MNDPKLPPLARGIRFTGDTYQHREYFASIGAIWNGTARHWEIAGEFDKWSLFDSLKRNNIQVSLLGSARASYFNIKYDITYDPELHRIIAPLQRHCRCTDKTTCATCQSVCCGQAKPHAPGLTEAFPRTHCDAHGTNFIDV